MNDPGTLVSQSCYYGILPDYYLLDCAINLLEINPLAVTMATGHRIETVMVELDL